MVMNLMQNPTAWVHIWEFAMSDEIQLPVVEKQLQDTLGESFATQDWDPMLKIIMDAKNNIEKALLALNQLTITIFGCQISQLSISSLSHVLT